MYWTSPGPAWPDPLASPGHLHRINTERPLPQSLSPPLRQGPDQSRRLHLARVILVPPSENPDPLASPGHLHRINTERPLPQSLSPPLRQGPDQSRRLHLARVIRALPANRTNSIDTASRLR